MPISHEIDSTRRVVRVTATGVVTFAEVVEHLDRLDADGDAPRPMRILWDTTALEQVELDGEQISDAVDIGQRLGSRLGRARVAIVAPGDLVYGLGRMAHVFAEGTNVALQPFRDADEAEGWLTGSS